MNRTSIILVLSLGLNAVLVGLFAGNLLHHCWPQTATPVEKLRAKMPDELQSKFASTLLNIEKLFDDFDSQADALRDEFFRIVEAPVFDEARFRQQFMLMNELHLTVTSTMMEELLKGAKGLSAHERQALASSMRKSPR